MFGEIPFEIPCYVFNYKVGAFEEIRHDRSDSCEDVIKELCRRWEFSPLVQLLFGLRVHGKKLWLAGCRQLASDEKYELRIRFKIPKLSDLKQLDKNAYDYFYRQVRHDVLHNAIPEIAYPKYKDEILGLCVIDMFLEIIENHKSIDELNKNCKKYVPKEIWRNHSVFAKRKIDSSLRNINRSYDAYYVKGVYLKEIDSKAPNYLTEEYAGTTNVPKEDDLRQGTCCIKMQIAPFHPEESGLRIYYPHKNTWQHISKFSDFYTIQIDELMNQVSLEIQNSPDGFPITMTSKAEIESFVSCLNGYYRLMVKWNMDLCVCLASPTLKFLSDLKIHGPIGGAFSYSKIEEKNQSVGSFIVRQCERAFDTFFIDIVTKENEKPETFKILYISTTTGNRWQLCVGEDERQDFDDLIDLAKSIPAGGRYFRLPPTQHDRSELLLLCRPRSSLKAELTSNVRHSNPVLLRALDDLLLYKLDKKEWGDGVFTRMPADMKQPTGKKVKVTLKILKPSEVERRQGDFLKLADKWVKVDLSEIVKLHGLTLYQPVSLVMESIEFGALDEFLRTPKYKKEIRTTDLVETAYSLAKALHYLQENQIVHGRIRCSTLQVMQFDPNGKFVVKLGDPGVPLDLTTQDVPWIAMEDYDDLPASQKNLKGDIWAYATTLWQIFSYGAPLILQDPVQFFRSGQRPQRPDECKSDALKGIYDLMMKGWDEDPEKRFSPQRIFTTLVEARNSLSRNYSEPINVASTNGTNGRIVQNGVHKGKPRRTTVASSDYNNGSLVSANTEHTYILTNSTQAYIENYPSSDTNSQGGSSQVSLLNGNSSHGSQSTMNFDDYDDYYRRVPTVLDFDSFRLIFQGEIGRGNYGCVFRGTKEDHITSEETEVAIKMIPPIESDVQYKDFQREAQIMRKLEHDNIVKIHEFREESPMLIIMEFVSQGSLQTYVSSNRPNLRVEDLLHFASNIANGMRYLEQKKIVHRDLAARNILVSDNRLVKIADFGLAQFIDGTGYYQATNNRALPLKWYAPETITYQRFSHKSDVWSFGVTLYEMFTFGESPNLVQNRELSGEEMLSLLEEGTRLPCPRFCPPSIYEQLMFICWDMDKRRRPSFDDLLRRAEELAIVNGERV